MMPEISIIMPLYNAEKFLSESLDSIRSQTFENYELICINDGSMDHTADIVADYQKQDSRICILTNESRQGAAYSRNVGLDAACGRYVIFLDGDDLFEEELLETAYQTSVKQAADIVIFSLFHVPSEEIHEKRWQMLGKEYVKRYCQKSFALKDLQPYEWGEWTSATCNKLFSLEFIRKNQLRFQNLSSSNDVYFVNMAFLLAEKMIMLNDNRIMIYARDHHEPSRISNFRDPMCVYDALIFLKTELKKRKLFGQHYQYFYYRMFFLLKATMKKNADSRIGETFYAFLRQTGMDQLLFLEDAYYPKLDDELKTCVKLFTNACFDAGKCADKNCLFFSLQEHRKRVIELWKRSRNGKRHIAIWGAGNNGTVLLDFCIKEKLSVDALIDMAVSKQGTTLRGYEICSYESVKDKIDVILVSAVNVCQSVIKIVGNPQIEIIDINSFLGLV